MLMDVNPFREIDGCLLTLSQAVYRPLFKLPQQQALDFSHVGQAIELMGAGYQIIPGRAGWKMKNEITPAIRPLQALDWPDLVGQKGLTLRSRALVRENDHALVRDAIDPPV